MSSGLDIYTAKRKMKERERETDKKKERATDNGRQELEREEKRSSINGKKGKTKDIISASIRRSFKVVVVRYTSLSSSGVYKTLCLVHTTCKTIGR